MIKGTVKMKQPTLMGMPVSESAILGIESWIRACPDEQLIMMVWCCMQTLKYHGWKQSEWCSHFETISQELHDFFSQFPSNASN